MAKKKLMSRKRREQTIAIIIVAAIVLIVTAAILLFVASRNENIGNGEHNHNHSEAAEMTLKVAVDAYEGEIHYNAAVKFEEQVESRTGGAVQVEVYPKGKLGDNHSLLHALETNSDVVDVVIAPVSDFTELNEKMDMSTLPFMFQSGEDAWNFLEGEIQSEIETELLDKNIRVLTHYAGEMNCIVSAQKVINTVADMNAMRFAVEENTHLSNVMQTMNANAIALDAQTAYQAIQQNKCDGYMGSLSDIYENHMFQKMSYLAVSYHTYDGLAFAISEETWRELGQYQQVVQELAKSSAYTDRELVKQEEQEILNTIKATGIRVLYPDMMTFMEKAEPYWRNFSSKYGSTLEKCIMSQRSSK